MNELQKAQILIIDKDPIELAALKGVLQGRYMVEAVECADVGLARAASLHPDLILLELTLSQIDGMVTCQLLRRDPHFHSVPIVVYSDARDIDQQLAVFEAGADAILTKPISDKDIHQTVSDLLVQFAEMRSTALRSIKANKMVEAVCAETAEMKQILEMMYRVLNAETFTDAGNLLQQELAHLGLMVCLQIRTHWDNLYFGCEAEMPAAKLMTQSAFDRVELKHYAEKTTVNYDHLTILVQNMPIHDESAYERLKDHLVFIGRAMSHRIDVLLLEQVHDFTQNKTTACLLNEARTELSDIAVDYGQVVHAEADLLNQTVDLLEGVLDDSYLNDDQRAGLLRILSDGVAQLQVQNEQHASLIRYLSQQSNTFGVSNVR